MHWNSRKESEPLTLWTGASKCLDLPKILRFREVRVARQSD